MPQYMYYMCKQCGSKVKKPKSKGENFFGALWFVVFLILIIISLCINIIVGILILISYILLGCLCKQKKMICSNCGSENLVPLRTPKGRELYEKYQAYNAEDDE